MFSNVYLAVTVPTFAVAQVVGPSVSQPGLDSSILDLLTSGGVLSIALGLGWFLLRRSDDREHNIRQQLKDELDQRHTELLAEQLAHATAREELIDVLRSCVCTQYEEE